MVRLERVLKYYENERNERVTYCDIRDLDPQEEDDDYREADGKVTDCMISIDEVRLAIARCQAQLNI
jgi:hypothetical protein